MEQISIFTCSEWPRTLQNPDENTTKVTVRCDNKECIRKGVHPFTLNQAITFVLRNNVASYTGVGIRLANLIIEYTDPRYPETHYRHLTVPLTPPPRTFYNLIYNRPDTHEILLRHRAEIEQENRRMLQRQENRPVLHREGCLYRWEREHKVFLFALHIILIFGVVPVVCDWMGRRSSS